MSAKHTPGPWACVHNSWEVSTVYADGHEVARCYISPDVTEETQDALEAVKDANARLIAAAPDLLEALKECEDWLSTEFEGDEEQQGHMHVLRQAQAAIAKAEGNE